MKNLIRSATLVAVLLLTVSLATRALAEAPAPATAAAPPALAKVMMKDSKVYVGELKSETDQNLTITDLATAADREIEKAQVLSLDRGISDDTAVRASDLATVVAWKMSKLTGGGLPTLGKVAKVTPALIYTTLGSDHGVALGQTLTAFRNEGDIKDPTTGKVLATERSRLGELEVVDVKPTYSKAKLKGNAEIKLVEGDEIELRGSKLQGAVFPLVDASGVETEGAKALAEQLTSKMAGRGINVVDRSLVSKAITDLAIQQAALFDAATAQQVGKQVGATAVLTGKLVPRSATSAEAQVRLINVQTGQILLAASSTISGAAAAGGGATAAGGGATTAPPAASGRLSALGSRGGIPPMFNSGGGAAVKEGLTFPDGKFAWTKKGDLLEHDFVFEIVFEYKPESAIPLVGLASFDATGDIGKGVWLRLHTVETAAKGDCPLFNSAKGGHGESFGHITTRGPHRLTITKTGPSVTFAIDVNNDGKTDDDLEVTIPDIKEAAPFFNNRNMFLFFGSHGMYYKQVGLKIIK